MDETVSTSVSALFSLGMVSVCHCGDLSSSGSTYGFPWQLCSTSRRAEAVLQPVYKEQENIDGRHWAEALAKRSRSGQAGNDPKWTQGGFW